MNLTPQGNFEEIASVTHKEGWAHAKDPTEFKEAVRPDVCGVGGEIVVTEVNGYGEYVRGTVLKSKSPSP